MTLQVIHVIWIDSTSEIGWDDCLEEERLTEVHSIGIFIKETADCLVLANSFDPQSGDSNCRISIPHSAVKKIRTLRKIKVS